MPKSQESSDEGASPATPSAHGSVTMRALGSLELTGAAGIQPTDREAPWEVAAAAAVR
jgi:hypothetical protein